MVKTHFLGIGEQRKSILDAFDYHKKVAVGDLSENTLKHYTTTEKYVKEFLQEQFNTTDIYLKEVADFCNITKNLTFHVARHTFATLVTLANGVPIETVSRMLGHTSLKTTQIYARIADSKIEEI